MGKSTIVLVTLAALGLGALIGSSLIDEEEAGGPVGAASAAIGPEGPPTGPSTNTGGAPVYRFLSPDSVTITHDDYGQAAPVANGENFIARDGALKTETVTIELDTDAVTEYKAVMKQGDSIAFRWSTDGGEAYYDFHAHDAAFGEEFFTRYAEGEGTGNAGSIVAAYDGQHGWFWLNIEGAPITITLEVMGFYDEIIKIDIEGY
jgi:hypothetical protein